MRDESRTWVRRALMSGAFFCVLATTIGMIVASASRSNATDPDQVVATIGDRKVTEKELDVKIKHQLEAEDSKIYDLKVEAIQAMAEQYALEQAAKKENLAPDAYLKKHLPQKKLTDADAKLFYDQHKEIQARYPKYDVIKGRLLEALQVQQDEQARETLLAELRKQQPVTVMLVAPRVEIKSAGHPERGPKDAPVTVVEFSDFQCPFCGRAEPTLKQVQEKYGDKVRVVYMDFPLGIHDHAIDAASAARCAQEQGKFWEFHDAMFADQSKLKTDDLKADAKKLGLDTAKFNECFDKGKYKPGVESDMAQGRDLGIDGTPAFFINGRLLNGAQPFEKFEETIDQELATSQKQARAN
ncbi:MAG TPA: thioredoxin domain-containing protein [Candidatus Binataceae bacterium]|nr:thioredoxin domain-containing protein [Candidatus Binataceae bacterium]